MFRTKAQAYINLALLLAVLVLQWQLWFGKGGFWDSRKLGGTLAQVQAQNEQKKERNSRAEADLRDLRDGAFFAESHARQQLDMVKNDEMFIQVTPLTPAVPASAAKKSASKP
jgi:cell division protein FtsB